MIGWTCDNSSPTICKTICGDGHIIYPEVCDDGNSLDNKGCLSDCTGSIVGWYCSGSTSSVCHTQCGDGFVVGTENCDDGTALNG